MRKIFILLLFLTSCATHSNTVVVLSKLSNSTECLKIDELKIFDNSVDLENFSIPNNDYLTINLSNNHSVKCYEFKYYPETSVNLNYYWKGGYLYILEMTGSSTNGHWLEKKFIFDEKQSLLIEKQTKSINFYTDDNGNPQKSISNWE